NSNEESENVYLPIADPRVISKLKPLLDSLSDQAVRMAVGKYDGKVGLVFGPLTVGAANSSYQVVLDYVAADTANVPLYIEREEYPDAANSMPTTTKRGSERGEMVDSTAIPAPTNRPKKIGLYDRHYKGESSYHIWPDPKSDVFYNSVKDVDAHGEKV